MAAASSSPFIVGMAKSVMTRSNLPGSNIAKASLPLPATSTSWPSKLSIILTASQTNGSSSTTRILRGGKAGALIGTTIGAILRGFGEMASNCCGHFLLAKRRKNRHNTQIAGMNGRETLQRGKPQANDLDHR